MQLDAFARAIETGEGRDWLHNSALATWVLMEACNESARTGTRVDFKAMHADLLGGVVGGPPNWTRSRTFTLRFVLEL